MTTCKPLIACSLCGNITGNKSHLVREMMYGTGDEFRYLECAGCGCLQLVDPPENVGKYYPPDYYSFARRQSKATSIPGGGILRRLRNQVFLSDSWLWKAARFALDGPPQLRAVALARPRRDARILDVGCGAGDLLADLAELGFANLVGIDAFIEVDHGGPPRIRKGRLEELQGTEWDLIMFHHSLEHMPDPLAALSTTAKLLSDEGCCLIRIPIVATPWRSYGVNWVEIDAPRHFHIHTERSLNLMSQKVGLKVSAVQFDSDEFQFWASELYKRGVPLSAVGGDGVSNFFTPSELKTFRARAKALNAARQGGRAAFLLTKEAGLPTRDAGDIGDATIS